MGSCLADRLGDLIDLSPAERAALEGLEQRERPLRRGAVLLRERDRLSDLFIVRRGMLMSYVLLHDGSRQILRFLFPGDVAALSALAYRQSPETITAITESVVAPVEKSAVAAIFLDHPRLAAMLLTLCQIERVTLTDRLAALGRSSAKARIAALLLELRNRMAAVKPQAGPAFTLGLTQEEIGDATGLTAVHVNRMLRQLEDERLIAREAGRFTILDEAGVARAANYVDRLAGVDFSWLPPGR